MMTKKLITAVLAGSLVIGGFSTSAFANPPLPVPVHVPGHGAPVVPWLIIGCAGGIILAAMAANARDNRELTTEEAWSCGTLFLLSQPKVNRVIRKG